MFCAATLSLVFYGLRGGLWQRLSRSTVVVVATFFSLSSAPLLALGLQFGLIAWDFATRRVPHRWLILGGGFAAAFIAVDIVSTRSPFLVLSSYLTFNTQTGYMRTYIWDYASADVLRHPLFGIGLNEWARPEWMPPSVDNFWLLTALRYGLPAFAFLALGIVFSLQFLVRRRITSVSISEVRRGLMVSLLALIFVGTTVHFWNATFCTFMFLLGSGSWMKERGVRNHIGIVARPATQCRQRYFSMTGLY